MIFILILFVVLVGGGWLLGKGVGEALFPDEKNTYIDKSVHYHVHEHKNITIIDPDTKKEIIVYEKSKNLN